MRLICSVVGVSASAYYAYRKRPQSGPAQLAEAALVDEIRSIWAESGGTYGSPRVCAELRRRGRVVNHKRVERLMKRHGMAGFVPRKRRVTTTSGTAHRRPDLLRGDFAASAPDVAWVGDIERHEAFSNRAVVKGHRFVLVAASALELRAA
ncbi:MAG: IS3 family transposase [bacterium]|nr:IS3 family transposase [bacterium]